MIQHNPVGRDRKGVLVQVDFHLLELTIEGHYISVDIGGGRDLAFGGAGLQ